MAGAQTDVDTTTALPVSDLRLAKFLDGDPPLPRAIFVVVSGDARGAILPVVGTTAIVGRVADADLHIDDGTVSRRHAAIRAEDDSLTVEDLGSSNGTTLNGNTIDGEIRLADGDLVGFGSAIVLVKRIR